jgi:hypothetical protein
VDLSPATDGFEGRGREGAPPVRKDRLRDPIALTGGVQDHEGDPPGCSGCHRARPHGPRGAVSKDEAPPLAPVAGTGHLAAVNAPTLRRPAGFIGVRLRGELGAGGLARRDSGRAVFVEGHETTDGSDGEVPTCQPTPEAELAGIGRPFLPLINRHHHGQPRRAWGRGTGFFVRQARQLVGFEAGNPPIHGWARDGEKPAEAPCVPPLRGEVHHADAGGGGGGLAMRRSEGQVGRCGCRTLLPGLVPRALMDAIPKRTQQHAGEFAVMKTGIERFEARPLLADDRGTPEDVAKRPRIPEPQGLEECRAAVSQLPTRRGQRAPMTGGVSPSGLSLSAVGPRWARLGRLRCLTPQRATHPGRVSTGAAREPRSIESCTRGRLG